MPIYENITKYDLNLQLNTIRVLRKKISKKFTIIPFIITFLITIFSIILDDMDLIKLCLVCLIIEVVALLLPPLTNIITESIIKRNYQKSIFAKNDYFTKYEFYEDYMIQRLITNNDEVSSTKSKYENFSQIKSDENFIFVYLGQENQCFVIDKKEMVIGNSEDLEVFLKSHIKG